MAYTFQASKVSLNISLAVKELIQQIDRLLQDLDLHKDKLIASGLSEKQAVIQILNEVKNETGIYQSFKNSQKKRIRQLEKSLVAKPVIAFADNNPNQKFEWVTSSTVKEHCGDCLYLSSQSPRTISEWRKLGHGLPRETLTECNAGCRCQLLPIE